jgi:hypothetical protein
MFLTVPNGGYVATIFLRAASDYLSTYGHTDTIVANWQYLNRTEAGAAVLVVEEIRMGRAMSVIHLTLYQDKLLSEAPWKSDSSRKTVVAYITNGRIATERGITLSTKWGLPRPPPPVDFAQLRAGQDLHWVRMAVPLMMKVPMLHNLEYYWPRIRQPRQTRHDIWVRLATGEPVTQSGLGYIVDAVPWYLVEHYRPPSRDEPVQPDGIPYNKGFWYPTLSMSLDIKQGINGTNGEEWLLLRMEAKVIRQGRMDCEVIVLDSHGEVVALSNHVALAVGIEKNYAGRESKHKM